ncbi:hypothetical protein BpHYR1_002265 [Brachionus plicatilis]|uniref:Uncharacterized protein n=1 Tax=Brachionus plicatilis TaxID=10195 RepID=A0A3M7SLR7_BRAPC|nr:hypothetical protein BpHYR1_002265 [Brachionus plicatilis]
MNLKKINIQEAQVSDLYFEIITKMDNKLSSKNFYILERIVKIKSQELNIRQNTSNTIMKEHKVWVSPTEFQKIKFKFKFVLKLQQKSDIWLIFSTRQPRILSHIILDTELKDISKLMINSKNSK